MAKTDTSTGRGNPKIAAASGTVQGRCSVRAPCSVRSSLQLIDAGAGQVRYHCPEASHLSVTHLPRMYMIQSEERASEWVITHTIRPSAKIQAARAAERLLLLLHACSFWGRGGVRFGSDCSFCCCILLEARAAGVISLPDCPNSFDSYSSYVCCYSC